MVRALLVRGMLAGLVAGVLAFGFARLFGEPPLAGAIGFEEAHAGEHGAEAVGRTVQSTLGLGVAVGVFAVALGGIFALVFALAHGRIGAPSARSTAAVLGMLGFGAVYLVPFLKYPANPPAVGSGDTIGQRTGMYFLMVLVSVVLAVTAVLVHRRVAPRLGAGTATVLCVLGYVVLVAVAAVLLPGVHEVPPGFPAATLWDFRVAAVGTQAVLWLVLSSAFGALADRVLRTSPARASTAG